VLRPKGREREREREKEEEEEEKGRRISIFYFPDTVGSKYKDNLQGNLFFEVLVLELRAFSLSHFTNPVFVKGFLR
jgi:hypothetical protein